MALRISTRVTTNLRRMYWRKAANVQPHEVIRILNQAKIKFVLVGAHGIAGWLDEPRATQDVDVVIQSQHPKAVEAIKKEYPNLTIRENSAVTQFIDPTNKRPVIDLIKSYNRLFKAVPKNAHQVGSAYRIPDLEMAIALKFAEMISSNRILKRKQQDQADLTNMVTTNREVIEFQKLRKLGELVKTGGGEQLVSFVEDIIRQTEAESDEGDF
jgi:hypothetical protein